MKILELDILLEPSFWASIFKFADKMSSSDAEDARSLPRHELDVGFLFKASSSIRFAKEYLPKIIDLLSQKYKSDIIGKDKSLPDDLKGKEILTVILTEEDRNFSSPERITVILDSISKLYSAVAELKGLKAGDLSVLSCDSGSDKSFDFLGAGKVISEVIPTCTDQNP